MKTASKIFIFIITGLALSNCVSYNVHSPSPVMPCNDAYRPLILFSFKVKHVTFGLKEFFSHSWDKKPYGLNLKVFAHNLGTNRAKRIEIDTLTITPAKEVFFVTNPNTNETYWIRQITPDTRRPKYDLISPDNPWKGTLSPTTHYYLDSNSSKKCQTEAMLVEHNFIGLKHPNSFEFLLSGRLIYEDGLTKPFSTKRIISIRKERVVLPFWIFTDME